jgi:hypothetical protein
MQIHAPNGGSGSLVARPTRERVGDPIAPAAKTRSSPPGSPGGGDAGNLACQGPGRPRRSGRRTRDTGGGGFGRRTANSLEHPPAGVNRPGAGAADLRVGRAARKRGDGHVVSKRSASWSSEHGTGSQRARRARQLVAAGKPRRKAGAEQEPHEWQRSSRPQRGRGANRRGSEKLRGRNVPGEASPGRADPVTDVAEGAPKPHEGNRRLAPLVGGEARTLRGRPKPVGAARTLASGPAGRRKTSRS